MSSDSESEDYKVPAKRKPSSMSRPKKQQKSRNLFEDEASDTDSEVSDQEREVSKTELSRHEEETQRKYDERRKMQEAFQSRSEAEIAQALEQRHRKRAQKTSRNLAGTGVIVSREGLAPKLTDPKLYAIRCKPGEEMKICIQLMNKFISSRGRKKNFLRNDPGIFSAVSQGSKGYLYLEAVNESDVKQAIFGLHNVFQKIIKIPLRDMVPVMAVKNTKTTTIPKKGAFVRLKTFPYKEDLCQIIKMGGNKVFLKVIPRIDYQYIRLLVEGQDDEAKKMKAMKNIPEQNLFNLNQINSYSSQPLTEDTTYSPTGANAVYVDLLGQYFVDRFLMYETTLRSIITEDIAPTIEELKVFDAVDEKNVVVEKVSFYVGDLVKVTSGSLENLTGKILDINDSKAKIESTAESKGVYEVNVNELQKLFMAGAHVKVLGGANAGVTGTLVTIENGSAIVFTDIGKKEILVDLNILKATSEISSGTSELKGFKTYDFVKMSDGSVGVIVQLSTENLFILDSFSAVKTMNPNLVLNKLNIRKMQFSLSALDSKGANIKIRDSVRITSGLHKGVEGMVRFIQKSTLFIHSKQMLENAGMIAIFSKHSQLLSTDTASPLIRNSESARETKVNPLFNVQRRPEPRFEKNRYEQDDLKGKSVKIKGGRFKGYIGMVVFSQGGQVKVELHTKNKTVTVKKDLVREVGTVKTIERQKPVRSVDPFSAGEATPRYTSTSTSLGTDSNVKLVDYSKLGQGQGRSLRTPAVSSTSVGTPGNLSNTLKTPGLSGSSLRTPGIVSTPGMRMSSLRTPAVFSAATPGLDLEGNIGSLVPKTPAGTEIELDNNDISVGGFKQFDKVQIIGTNEDAVINGFDGTDIFLKTSDEVKIVSANEIRHI